jgi:formate/nitrite transporter FocA (FNT family)
VADQDQQAPRRDEPEAEKSADAKQLHRAVREEGEAELERPLSSLFWSGLAGGLAITASLIVEGALEHGLPQAQWRQLVIALGYPIGFVIVILGRMQLFTESTVTAMLPFVTKPSTRTGLRTARLWGVVLIANLIGTATAAFFVAHGWLGGEDLTRAMLALSAHVAELDAWRTFINAIPAGIMIAIVAWVLPNARGQAIFVIFAIGYVIAVGEFSHSIVGSVEVWLLLFSGETSLGAALGQMLLPAILGNLLGGAGLFALLAHAQVRGEMAEAEAASGARER